MVDYELRQRPVDSGEEWVFESAMCDEGHSRRHLLGAEMNRFPVVRGLSHLEKRGNATRHP